MSKRLLDKENEIAILKSLKVNDFNEVANLEYPEIRIRNERDREKAKKFSCRLRGSVRLSAGYFYTEEELREKRKRIDSLKLRK